MKGLLIYWELIKYDFFYDEFYYGFNYFREISNKPSVKIVKSDKGLYLFKVDRCNLLDNSLNFNRVHSQPVYRY